MFPPECRQIAIAHLTVFICSKILLPSISFFLFSISGGPSRWWGFHEVSTHTAGCRAEGGQCSQVSTCHLHQLPASQAFHWIHYLLLTALTFHLVHRKGLIILIEKMKKKEKMIMCMHTCVTERALDHSRVWNRAETYHRQNAPKPSLSRTNATANNSKEKTWSYPFGNLKRLYPPFG